MTFIPSGLRVPGLDQLDAWATDAGFAAGWMMVRAMPEFVARNAFDAGALLASRGGGPEQLRKNLARVLGVAPAEVPSELMRASLASYARYWREAFRLPTMDHAALAAQLHESVSGRDRITAALAAGRGAVLALAPTGNLGLAGGWRAQTPRGVTTGAATRKNATRDRRFLAFRESLGFEVLPLSGGERPPFETLAQRLADNKLVCLMADRDLTRSGVAVDFFGESTRMPAGPARLAIETGAALLPAHCWFEGSGWGIQVHDPLDCSGGDVDAIIQALADKFAEGIAAHPADWHMMQPQWVADLPESRRARLGES